MNAYSKLIEKCSNFSQIVYKLHVISNTSIETHLMRNEKLKFYFGFSEFYWSIFDRHLLYYGKNLKTQRDGYWLEKNEKISQ